jgi:hypothetical protein
MIAEALRAAPALLAAAALASCSVRGRGGGVREDPMDEVAERYVRLVLALGEHDADYVDAYYGPPAWREEAKAARWPLAEIARRADGALAALGPAPSGDETVRLRHSFLRGHLESLRARVDMLSGRRLSFDEEARALYGVVPPRVPEERFLAAAAALERVVPGEGPIAERLEAYEARFRLPADRVRRVFELALAECRARTLRHMALPAGERFELELVTGKPWSGYNWYRGGYESLIQLDTDLPVPPDALLHTACHEGYPGHHVQNALLESALVRGRGWIEFTVYPLFSPLSLLAEGTANYGVDLAFPEDERVRYDESVLWPAAGLDPAEAARFAEVQRLRRELRHAGTEAARLAIDGGLDDDAVAAWIVRHQLRSPERARKSVSFIRRYRSYVVNYSFGEDLVRAWVERRAGADPQARWRALAELLAMPRLPRDLL